MSRFALGFSVALLPCPAFADDLLVLVVPRDTPAAATAARMTDGTSTVAFRRIHQAFDAAALHMVACGDCTVTIRLAAGSYTGRGDTGMWVFPEVAAPGAALHILGGWDADFQARDPFDTPSLLVSTAERSAPVLHFEGRRAAMRELVISGLVFDTSPSNSYDADSQALMKGGSSTWVQLALGYLETTHLTIADNVFMNAPEGVAGPQLRTPDAGLRIDIQNNVFFNSVTPWTIPGGVSEDRPSEIAIRGNTFLLNWPRNPDPTTSNPGSLQIGNAYAADHVRIEDNIFAWNVGGAIHSEWDHDRSPDITIRNNLFWQNGQLFGATEDDDGALVGKFNGAASHAIYSATDLEDDFNWTTAGNQSFDPRFRLDPPDLRAVSYGSAFRGQPAQPSADTGAETALDPDTQAQFDDFAAQLALLTGEGADDAATGNGDVGGVRVFGPDHEIANYAPRLSFAEVGIPMPRAADAAPFGASPDRVWRAD